MNPNVSTVAAGLRAWPPSAMQRASACRSLLLVTLSALLHAAFLRGLLQNKPPVTLAQPLPAVEIGLITANPPQPAPAQPGPQPQEQARERAPAPAPMPERAEIPLPRKQKPPKPPRPQPRAEPRPQTPPLAAAPAATAAVPAAQPAPAATAAVTEASFHANYLHNPKPPYPEVAKRRGWEGKTILRVQVAADGSCSGAEIQQSSGHEILDASALNTVKMWKFVPAKRGDTPVASIVNVPIAFHIDS